MTAAPRTPAAGHLVAPPPGSTSFSPWLLWSSLLLVSLLAYCPALTGGLLWDDAGHVTRPDLRSLSGLVRIWFEVGATQQYYPLLHSAFWLEHRLWGDATLGYHLVNVILHATAALLFARVLQRLAAPAAWFAALLFALHPVCVESVAWISEQKNTLSAVFYLASLLSYLRFERERSPSRYVVATALFVCALLTKTVTASLPAALLVLFWWQRGRLSLRHDVLPLVPWFAASLLAAFITARFEHDLIGAQGADFSLSFAQRLLLAGRAPWFYLAKLVWPFDLAFIYPRWKLDAGDFAQGIFPLATFAILTAFVWLVWRRRQRAPLAVALLFVGTLFPALGFVNVFPFRYSFVADHFQYLASLPLFSALAVALAKLATRWPAALIRSGAVALPLLLGILTWQQSHIYADVFTLYRDTVKKNPACWMAHNNLGIALVDAGQPAEALSHYEAALRAKPDYAEAENNFGFALVALGRFADAVPHYRRAVQLQRNYAQAKDNLGVALISLGRTDEALASFAAAIRDNPRFAGAHYNLGLALARLDRTDEAITHFAAAVRLQPDYADAEFNWGIGLMLTGRFAEARSHFERALRLAPDSVLNHTIYARALAEHRLYDEAVNEFTAALRLDPAAVDAHLGLAFALRQLGRTDEAQYHVIEARRLAPSRP